MKEVAAEEDVEVYRVLGFMLSHCTKSNYADLWKSIWEDKRNKSKPTSVMETHVPILTAMTIYSDCGPGQQSSTNQRKLFSLAGYDILSLWYKLKEEQKKKRSPVLSLPTLHVGVYYQFLPVAKIQYSKSLENEKENRFYLDFAKFS